MADVLTIRYADDDQLGRDLDEIVADGARVHVERMDAHYFALVIEQDGLARHFHIGAKRAVVRMQDMDADPEARPKETR